MTASTAPRQDLTLGILCAIGGAFCFASANPIIKAMGERGFDVWQMLMFRNIGGLLVLLPLISRGGIAVLHTSRPWGHVTRSGLGVLAMLSLFSAMTMLPLAEATAIQFSAPLIITALSVPLLGERVGLHRWSAVIIGFLGVLLIVQPGGGSGFSLGVAVALAAALFQALAMIAVRQLNRTERPEAIVFYLTLASLVVSAIGAVFVWRPPTLEDLGLLMLIGVSAGVGNYLMTLGYRYTDAAVAGLFNYTQFVWALIYGALFFAEAPTPLVLAGVGVLVASGGYIALRETWLRRVAQRAAATATISPPPV